MEGGNPGAVFNPRDPKRSTLNLLPLLGQGGRSSTNPQYQAYEEVMRMLK